ncbi:MAG: cation transporter, partial [Planctomycetota bacterium]
MTEPTPLSGRDAQITILVEGLHCASCVGRVEQALRQLRGVRSATVNLAARQARIAYDPAQVSLEAIKSAVTNAGYQARDWPEQAGREEAQAAEFAALRRKVIVALVFAAPVAAISMFGLFEYPWRNWALLALTLPVF